MILVRAAGVTARAVMSALAMGGIAPFTALTLASALFIFSAAAITRRGEERATAEGCCCD